MSIRHYPTAEFIVEKPHQTNNYRWCWCVFLPDTAGQPTLTSGYGRDREHATQCAATALHAIQNGYEIGETYSR